MAEFLSYCLSPTEVSDPDAGEELLLFHHLSDARDDHDRFTAIMHHFCSSVDKFAYQTEHHNPEEENDRIFSLSERILRFFPGFANIRRNLFNLYRQSSISDTRPQRDVLNDEGATFSNDFSLGGTQQNGRYSYLDETGYIDWIFNETRGLSRFDVAMHYMNYHCDQRTDSSLRAMAVEIDKEIPGSANQAYRKRMLSQVVQEAFRHREQEFKRYAGSLSKKKRLSDRIDMICQHRSDFNSYVNQIRMLKSRSEDIIGMVTDEDIKEMIFKDGQTYGYESFLGFSDIIGRCNENLSELKKKHDWKGLFEVVASFPSLSMMADVAATLLSEGISDEAENFLRQYPVISHENFTIFLKWFEQIPDEFDPEQIREYFDIMRPYGTEFAMMERYLRTTSFLGVGITLSQQMDYVLGKDYTHLSISEQEMMLKKRNALKIELGESGYKALINDIIDPDRLKEVLPDSQHQRLRDFLASYNALPDLPIHEYRINVISRNKTFMMEIEIPGKQQLKTFVKIYDNQDAFDFERKVLEWLKNKNVKAPIPIASSAGETPIQMFSFIDGDNLYNAINRGMSNGALCEAIKESVRQLPGVQNGVGELCQEEKINIDDTAGRCFAEGYTDYHLAGCGIVPEVLQEIKSNMRFIYKHYSRDPKRSYFKDANPRNLMVQGHDVFHIDYEYKNKAFPEMDLTKLFRNGKDYSRWDQMMDYKADEYEQKGADASAYLETQRYLTDSRQEEYLELYNLKRRENGESEESDAEASMIRFNYSAILTHVAYIGLYSTKLNQSEQTQKDREISRNRMQYHMLEAKVLLDQMSHDEKPCVSEDTTMISSLRASLDKIEVPNG